MNKLDQKNHFWPFEFIQMFSKTTRDAAGEVAFKDGNEMTKDPLDLKKNVKVWEKETLFFCIMYLNAKKH